MIPQVLSVKQWLMLKNTINSLKYFIRELIQKNVDFMKITDSIVNVTQDNRNTRKCKTPKQTSDYSPEHIFLVLST